MKNLSKDIITKLRKRERILFLSRRFFYGLGFLDVSPFSEKMFLKLEKKQIKKAFTFDGEKILFFSRSHKDIHSEGDFIKKYFVFLLKNLKRKSIKIGEKDFTPFTIKYKNGQCLSGDVVLAKWSLDSKHFSAEINIGLLLDALGGTNAL